MEANEIRIGNYVNLYDDFNAQVTGMTNTGDVWCVENPKNKECAWVISNIKPIPLTDEWLLKFGFELKTTSWKDKYYVLGSIFIENEENKWGWSTNIGEYNDIISNYFINHLKYVHQLQNLYHALTNKELSLK